jgi:small subunit ribosomal protein S18
MVPSKAETTNTEALEPAKRKKVCAFCASKTIPSYTDSVGLKRFVSTRGKIVPKLRSGLCSRHQRGLTIEVKRARFLALLPFMLKA